MKIIILEDEPLAQQRMIQLLQKADPEAEILHCIDGVESGLMWFKSNSAISYDLIIADIQLGDGSSFELLEQINSTVPIIFVTAYDSYALNAFEYYSVAYLLKPVQPDALAKALQKAKNYSDKFTLQSLSEMIRQKTGNYQQRLIVKYGNQIKAITIDDIAAFYVEERVVMLSTFEKRQLAVDQNLEQLEQLLDPTRFFRINRKVIVHIRAIKNMEAYTRSRVLIELEPPIKSDLVVSTERASSFKKWLEG
jgi:DNA-binding LytR/AlgR family response regulator